MVKDERFKLFVDIQREQYHMIDYEESEKTGCQVIYNDIGNLYFSSVPALCDLLNELNNENKSLKARDEDRKSYQRVLEAKIRRLKDRVKIFEKNYSTKDRQRIRDGELKGCLR